MILNMVAREVFQTLLSYDYTVEMFDEDSNRVYEPEEARRFYATPEGILVAVIDEGDNSRIRLCIGPSTNLVDVLGLNDTLRTTATKFNLLYKLSQMTRDINLKDFATLSSVNEGQMGEKTMNLTEGMYGTTRSSYLKLENARMIVRHSKKIDENVFGSRGRHVEAIFVENAQGERFLFPTRQMAPARAMTQHVNQGGSFADEVGAQISRMAQDFSALATGSSYIGANAMALDESVVAMREEIRESMREMRRCFERLYRPSGYIAESERILERANMLIENDDQSPTFEEIKESLFVEGAELSDEVISAITEALKCKKGVEEDVIVDDEVELDENQQPQYVVKDAQGEFLSADNQMVEDKEDAAVFNTKDEAVAAAKSAGIREFKLATHTREAKETIRVLGREVDVHAWDAFKNGKLDLMGEVAQSDSAPQFRYEEAKLLYKAREVIPYVKDDTMLNLISFATELATEEHASPKEKKMAMAIVRQTVNIVYPKSESFVSKSSALREFVEWFNTTSVDTVMEMTDEDGWEEFRADDTTEYPVDKDGEIDYVVKNFDVDKFLTFVANDIAWVETDPRGELSVEERTLEKSDIIDFISFYLSKELEKDAGIEDEDMSKEAATLYDVVAERLTGNHYIINEAGDLTRDDVVIPDNEEEDLMNEVKSREYDAAAIERLKSLAGQRVS